MSNIKEYFSSVGKGIKSLVAGMEVTGKELVTKKITECYPENRDTLQIPERFRAVLTLKYDEEGRHKCIGCGICQMNCPNGSPPRWSSFPTARRNASWTSITTTWAAVHSVCSVSQPVRRMRWNSAMTSSRPYLPARHL